MITKDTKIIEVISKNPNAAKVFAEYGMGCIGCLMAHGETVEQACATHQVNLQEMLEKLNKK